MRRPALKSARGALTRVAKSQKEKDMRWSAIGLGLGAAVLLIPALVYVLAQRDPENRSSAKAFLVPGLIVLGIAAGFAALWLMRRVG